MKKMTMLIAVLFGTTVMGMAQNDKVLGLVVEIGVDGKEAPLPGASAYWLGTTKGAVTGINGVFLLEKHKTVNRLIVSYVGYKADTLTVDAKQNVKVVLEPDQLLSAVTVEGNQTTTTIDRLKGVNVFEISQDELCKAACCNLSESFETTPSVDVSFTDAVTGTRQIQMLGLAGPNTLIGVENMPGVRGLAANYGLSYIPGSWISSIQVTKGVGSVVNGSESIAGHINIELKKPRASEKLFINGYTNQSGRVELNTNFTNQLGNGWATTTLLHASARPFETDGNGDDFLDFPTGHQLNLVNRWEYTKSQNWIGQVGIKVMLDEKQGGQTDYDAETDRNTTNRYGLEINTKRYEAFAKLGHVFPDKEYKSYGFQFSASHYELDSYYGMKNDYNATQSGFYGNFIYQSILGSTRNKVKAGASFVYDDFDETLNALDFARKEAVPGAFVEYTYDNLGNLTLVLGARVDHNSLFGTYFTPRMHVRYSPSELTMLRLSAGKGRRTASVIAENAGILASSRQIIFDNIQTNKGYGYQQEEAWNFGFNVAQDFTIDYRDGTVTLDAYHTRFDNQVILDLDRDVQQAVFSSLAGDSYSNSIQLQVDYELLKRLDLRMAYRWLDVQVDYTNESLQKPLIAKHRAFINAMYETRNDWSFDYTLHWTGKQRIPNTSGSPVAYQRAAFSADFMTMNAQVTKVFGDKWAVYIGGENLTNFKQDNAIVAAADPFGPYFDSTLVWAPVNGAMAYAGFRFTLE